MKIINTPFVGSHIIQVQCHQDDRGDFTKIFNLNSFNRIGIDFNPSEIFISTSAKNVIRGMHLPLPPFDGGKIIYCVSGIINDVLIDLRPDSITKNEIFSVNLDSNDNLAIFVPAGVAHGFLSKSNNAVIAYATDTLHKPEYDGGIRWDSIGYEWPCRKPILSSRDLDLPLLANWNNPYSKLSMSDFVSTPKRVVVTGANGFLGSKIIEELLTLNWDVKAIVRENSAKEPVIKRLLEGQVFVYNGQFSELDAMFKDFKPDYIFHTAACTFYDYEMTQIDEILNSNIKFGIELLEAMKLNNIKNIINTGTSWQHFNNERYNPVNLYAATKQAFQDILDYYVDDFGFKVITLKLFDTYGSGDSRNKILNILFNAAKNDEEVDLSSGTQIVDMVWVTDVAQAFVLATEYFKIEEDGFHLEYGLSGMRRMSLKDAAEEFCSYLDIKLKINFGKRSHRSREVYVPWNPPRTLPNWTPTGKSALIAYAKDLKNEI